MTRGVQSDTGLPFGVVARKRNPWLVPGKGPETSIATRTGSGFGPTGSANSSTATSSRGMSLRKIDRDRRASVASVDLLDAEPNFPTSSWSGDGSRIRAHAPLLRRFVNTNPSEFLILRFTKSADCVDDMVTEVQQLAPVRVYTSMTNIAQTRVQSLAGKLVLVFDDGFRTALRANPNFTGGAPNYVTFNQHLLWFDKYPIMIPTGLSTCGEYADDDKMEKVYSKMKDQATEHYTHQSKDQHLHFVYWQQTIKMGDIRKATEGKEGAHEMLDVFAKEAVANVLNAVWDIPNVISHDFVKQATCSKIIDINQRLGKI